MRYTSLLTACCLGLATFSLGCEERVATTTRTLMESLDTLEAAERGYVPAESAEMTYHAYRLSVYEDVEPDLRRVASDGSRREQVVAHRLLGDIHASRGRAQARQARHEAAELGTRTSVLLGYLAAADRAAARVQRLEGTSELVIEQLNEELRELRQELARLEAEEAEHRQSVEALTAERDRWREQADEAYAEARRIRDRAFVADGDDRYELETEADEQELAAHGHAAEAEKIDARLDVAEAEAALATARQGHLEALIEQLQEQIQRARAGDQSRAESREEARAALAEANEALVEAFQDVLSVHEQAVVLPLTAAREQHLAAAIEQFENAERHAVDADTGTSVLWELTDAYTEQLRMIVEESAAVGRLGRITAIFAGSQAPAQPFAEALDRFNEQQDDLFAEAHRIEQLLVERIDELDQRPGAERRARTQRQRLDVLMNRLDASALR